MEGMMKDMLRLDVVRGPHSTGMAAVNGKKEVLLAKKAMLPDDLLCTRESKDIFKGVSKAIIGHNRYATKGCINNVNAHPFHVGDIVGAHNGTIRAQWRLPDNVLFDVDSENVFHAINVLGAKETIELLDGAYALTWYDQQTSMLQMVRNSERPLVFALTEDKKSVVWASEEWMLIVAASRNKIRLGALVVLPPHTLFTFDIFGDLGAYKSEPVTPFQVPQADNSTQTTTTGRRTEVFFAKGLFLQDPIEFEVVKITSLLNNTRVLGKAVDYNCEVLLYLGNGYKPQIEQMRDSVNTFEVVVSSAIGNKSAYANMQHIIGNPSTIVELIPQEDIDADDNCYESKGTVITKTDFDEHQRDCAWCSDPLAFEDQPALVGIATAGRHQFVCSSCAQFDEVKEYLGE